MPCCKFLLVLLSACCSAQIANPNASANNNSPGVPSGMILLTDTSCPSGWTEMAQSGKYLLLTTAAGADAGTSGGSLTFTPTVSSTSLTAEAQTVNSLTAAAQTISGSTAAESTHTHSVTSNVAPNVFTQPTIAWPVGVPTHSGTTATFSGNAVVAASTNSGTKLVTGNTSTGVSPVTTATGTVNITSQGTIAWPAGVPTASGGAVSLTNNAVTSGAGSAHSHGVGTLANAASAVTGTMNPSAVSGSITMNASTIQPTYLKLIPCKKD